ncbi:MAG: STAS domain-containing protein [Cytophagales bacterium]|nr:STAS domain-containing protein [Cytophagales bacterium]
MTDFQYIKLNKKDNELHVSLKGEYVLSQIKEVYEEFLSLVESTEQKIFISLRDLQSLDLTGIQLLVSFKKTMLEKNKEIIVDDNYPKEVKELLLVAGYSNI